MIKDNFSKIRKS